MLVGGTARFGNRGRRRARPKGEGAKELTIGMLRADDPRGTRDDDGSTATGAAGATAAVAR